MVHPRQVENLSRIQVQRVAGRTADKLLLSRYGLWDNPRATRSTRYGAGCALHRKPVRVEWIHPSELVDHKPVDFPTYRQRVRHFTNTMAGRYGHPIRGAENLNVAGHEVDHILSVYDGFDKHGRQTPWAMLCHPANLQVITAEENLSKGRVSDISPKHLMTAIREFNRKHGTVLVPVDSATLTAVRDKYSAMAKHRRRA